MDAICDRVVVMHAGRIRFAGSTDELKATADESLPGHTPLEQAYLGLLPQDEVGTR